LRRGHGIRGDLTRPSPRSPQPAYEELGERLRELIDVHGLGPGDGLMSDRDLAERLGVSCTSNRY
jgi:DNA-binding FadR family transcriptional regulator